MQQIRITAKSSGVSMTATLNDTETSKGILGALPIEAAAQTWGDEIYFKIDCKMDRAVAIRILEGYYKEVESLLV